MFEQIRENKFDDKNKELQMLDSMVKSEISPLDDEITESYKTKEEEESGEIHGVDNRINHGVNKSLVFSMTAKLLIGEEQRNQIKNGISTFFKNITYQDGNNVIVYDTDAKIISSIDSFLNGDLREKVRSNWTSIKMEEIIRSVVGRTINYPQNKFLPKKKESDGTLVDTTPAAIKTNLIDSFKTVLKIT